MEEELNGNSKAFRFLWVRGFTDYLSVSTFSRFKAKFHPERKARVVPALLHEFAARFQIMRTRYSGIFCEHKISKQVGNTMDLKSTVVS